MNLPAALLLLCLLSGCATPRAPAEDAAASDVSTSAASAADPPVPKPAVAAPTPPPAPLEGLTSFHWALKDTFPGYALQLDLALGRENACNVTAGAASGSPGPSFIALLEADGGHGWSVGSSGEAASLHVGDVDTRSDEGGGASASRMTRLSGDVRVTFLAQDGMPGDAPFIKGDTTLAFSIACKDPFAIRDAQAGTQALLLNAFNLGGGAGAHALFAGSATVQDTASLEFTAPRTRAAGGGFGIHGGHVTVTHPAGSTEWLWAPTLLVPPLLPSTFFLDDGPGTIGFTADHAGAYFHAFWLAAWGLDGPIDLRANEVAESALDLGH